MDWIDYFFVLFVQIFFLTIAVMLDIILRTPSLSVGPLRKRILVQVLLGSSNETSSMNKTKKRHESRVKCFRKSGNWMFKIRCLWNICRECECVCMYTPPVDATNQWLHHSFLISTSLHASFFLTHISRAANWDPLTRDILINPITLLSI